jgi:molybdopterin-binding protein
MNILNATLTSITSSEQLSILTVSVGEYPFYLLLVEQCHESIGEALKLVFKETEVILSKTAAVTTANTQSAMVQKIECGDVLSQITLMYHNTVITALVPTLSFNALDIHEGDEIYWMVSPSEISLLRGTHGN